MKEIKVLLIEDNSADEILIKRAFKKAGIKSVLTVLRDGAAALDYLFCTGEYATRNIEDVPQVIILDLKLPKIDGLQVLKRLRSDARTKLLPIIILTSSKEEEDLIAGYKSGANSYVVKPISEPDFSNTIQQMGLYWLGLNEPLPQPKLELQ